MSCWLYFIILSISLQLFCVHHLIGSLLPEIWNNATFLQIYFMSQSDQISIRTNMIPKLKRGLIESLQFCVNIITSYRSSDLI